jgi:hypothetical protein
VTWLRVWTRAVIAPAYRRAGALWTGSAIVGGFLFGANGMEPHDVTGLATHRPGIAAVLAITWLLLFLPTARMLLRPDGAAFLASLPSPPLSPRVLLVAALLALQLPWLLLWLLGEHAFGLAVVLGWTLVIAVLAMWRPRPRAHRVPRWSSAITALAAVYTRALLRRSSDALIRGVGLAILAGLVGGLMIRNNAASGERVAVLATCAISIVLVPGWAGALMPLVEVRRQAAWLAHSLGISRVSRVGALLAVVAAIYVASLAIAVASTTIIAATSPRPVANPESIVMHQTAAPTPTLAAFALFAVVALSCGLSAACLATRAILHADVAASDDPRDAHRRGPAATRVVIGAIAAAMLVVIALAWLGALGAHALVALGIAGISTARNG